MEYSSLVAKVLIKNVRLPNLKFFGPFRVSDTHTAMCQRNLLKRPPLFLSTVFIAEVGSGNGTRGIRLPNYE